MARRLKRVLALCNRRGFLLQRASAASSTREFDYGPLGAELKRNLINEWCVLLRKLNNMYTHVH